jgi:hypothetical protein
VLDVLGLFGAGADFSVLKALGVFLIIAGGALVVSYWSGLLRKPRFQASARTASGELRGVT